MHNPFIPSFRLIQLSRAVRLLTIITLLLFSCSQLTSAQTRRVQGDSFSEKGARPDTLVGDDSLLRRMEEVHATLNRINNVTDRGFDTHDIEQGLPDIQANLQVIKENLTLYNRVLNTRNLQMFKVLLGDMQQQINDWRSQLFDYNDNLLSMHSKMETFMRDTMLNQLYKDTLFRRLYQNELTDIRKKWKLATQGTSTNLTKINELQASVSNSYFLAMELQQQIRQQLRKTGVAALGQEYACIWNIHEDTTSAGVVAMARKSYNSQRRVLQYYFKKHNDNWLWILLTGALFFAWVFSNYRKVKKAGVDISKADFTFTYLTPLPILASVVILFNAAPFFDLNPPSVYVETMQFFLLITLTIFFKRNGEPVFFKYWLVMVGLYIALAFTNVIVTPGKLLRISLLLIHLASVGFGWKLLQYLRKQKALKGFVRPITIVYIVFNILAAFCNIIGRLSVAKVMGSAAIFGLTQMVGLTIFMQLLTEAFYLQMIASRIKGGVKAVFDYDKVQKGLNRLLSVIVIVCWIIIFTTNLNLYNALYSIISRTLTRSHTIGSTTFSIGNIVLFFAIIYVSNILQKYVGYFFGETSGDFSGEMEKKGSKLAILRLTVLLIGFLLAIAASGLPVDKITVVLGALGVGIGLGLQNIVNNLVSGIILIFEKPLQLGDFIEVGDKKGKVRDIGIRSSRIITSEGAEVIMPNGDLLSGRVVNWTLSNNHVRTALTFTIQPVEQLDLARTAIMDALQEHESLIQKMPADVLVSAINDAQVQVTARFWVSSVYKEHEVRSELLLSIYQRLKGNGIKVM
ncbi:mechanosensitive ion channel family protein [Deminuibacter soli]|nr:mechanosensitive ion channel domain-containing protein [Deminuibacter soli]